MGTRVKKRPLRNKKDWRKRIDLEDIESRAQAAREAESYPSVGPLFTIDVAGKSRVELDSSIKKGSKSVKDILEDCKKLKARERHAKKSLSKFRRNSNEIREILEVQPTAEKYVMEMDNYIKSEPYDIWAAGSNQRSEIATKPKRKNFEVPHAGKSYNPSLHSWRKLLNAELKRVKHIEILEKQIAADRAKEIALRKNPTNVSEQEVAEAVSDEDESEWCGIHKSLPIPRKTSEQRAFEKKVRREKRSEDRKAAERQLLRDIDNISEIMKAVSAERNARLAEASKKKSNKEMLSDISSEPFEVKLQEELDDSLRRLKPESNLLRESFARLNARRLF